jgi:hypothetical protein
MFYFNSDIVCSIVLSLSNPFTKSFCTGKGVAVDLDLVSSNLNFSSIYLIVKILFCKIHFGLK